MTEPENDECLRSAPRHEVTDQGSVEVVIHRRSTDSDVTLKGELYDLSPRGALICLPTCPQVDEVMDAEIIVQEAKLKIDLSIQVRWSDRLVEDRWLVGCSITPPISEDVIRQLVEPENIDCRHHPRFAVNVRGTARWESQNDRFPIVLKDYSAGGFCVSCAQAARVGQKIFVDLTPSRDSAREIAGKVRWQLDCGGQYLVGCALDGEKSLERLRELGGFSEGHERHLRRALSSVEKDKRRHTAAIAALWVLVFCSSALLGLSFSYRGHGPMAERDSATESLTLASLGETHGSDDSQTCTLGQSDEPVASNVASDSGEYISGEGRNDHPSPDEDASDATSAPFDLPHAQPAPHTQDDQGGFGAEGPIAEGRDDRSIDGDTLKTSEFPDELLSALASEAICQGARWASVTQSAVMDAERNIKEWSLSVFGGELNSETTKPDRVQHALGLGSAPTAFSLGAHRRASPSSEATGSVAQLSTPKPPARSSVGTPERDDRTTSPLSRESSENIRFARDASMRGGRLYRLAQFEEAAIVFRDAVQHDRRNALYRYLYAMTLYQLREKEEAEKALSNAVLLERLRPVEDLGALLSRYQGHPRLWVERQRLTIHESRAPIN